MSIEYKGKKLSFLIKGESHSKNIYIKIKGYPKKNISISDIDFELKKRNQKLFFNTQRKENDEYKIIKGIKNNKISKNTIEAMFFNNDVNEKPYIENEGFLRPNQSDYAQYLKNKKIKSGAGMFSGRMTLPIVFIGAITKTILKEKGIKIASRIKSVYDIKDKDIKTTEEIFDIEDKFFPTITSEFKEKTFDLLKEVMKKEDSVGGIIETYILNLEAGYGDKYFDRLESKLSQMIFSIPAIKGLEFGLGFDFTKKLSSEVLDEYTKENGTIKTKTNNSGGINGGVSNGMPIIIKTAIKPIGTIKKEITSYNYIKDKEETVKYSGNHDVFIGNRIIPVIESVISIALLDEILYEESKNKGVFNRKKHI